MKRFIIALALAVVAVTAFAQDDGLRVHSLFQSNMVIQRGKKIAVWGWAKAGVEVTVAFSDKEGKATADKSGAWKVALPAMTANAKPQEMIISGGDKMLTLDNVLVGDIWVIGGQSNMQHPLARVEDGPMEIVSANFPKVRLLTIPPVIDHKTKDNFPRRQKGKQADGDWDVCTPTTVREFSGIGYIFGRRLHMASQVPIGLIDLSRWGTTVEAWTPLAVLKGMESDVVRAQLAEWDKRVKEWDPKKDLESRIARYNRRMEDLKKKGVKVNPKPPTDLRPSPLHNQNYPGNCYASFIAPVAGFPVKGAIFHQGFNNSRVDAAAFYYQVFPKMITSWRAAFNDPKMAFGIISLCTDGVPQTLDNYCECMSNLGIYVREAQYKTFLDFYKAGDKNVGFASSYDLRRAWYHPQHKIPAGERIARWALATQYGFERSVFWKPPMVTKMELGEGKILLHMDIEVGSVDSQAIAGFAIAGKDKKYQPAQAECLITGTDARGRQQYNRKVLVLKSLHVPKPIHFRYGWGRNPMGNLQIAHTNRKDIPFGTQRSDNWAFWDVPYAMVTDEGESRESRDKIRKALRMVDIERRLQDAKWVMEEMRAKHLETRRELGMPE